MAKVGYRIIKNPLKSKDKAKYVGVTESTSVASTDELVSRVARDTNLSERTVNLVRDELVSVMCDELVKGNSVQLPLATFEPVIEGSFDAEDALFDSNRNKLVIRIRPSADSREAVAEIVPERLDAPVSDLTISAVLSPSLGSRGYNAVRAGESFTVCGTGLDESVAVKLTDAKGEEHVLSVELAKVVSMICRVEAPVAKGSATLTVTKIGGQYEDATFTATRKVRVVS